MKIFAISDLHLSFGSNKPMDVFGGHWENYLEKITEDWNKKVSDEDVVLIAGDISWAMKLEDTKEDFEFLGKLKGHKVIIRGNHDYWWSSISAVRSVLPEKVYAIQNDAIKFGDYIICGTRGWTVPEAEFETPHDEKIYKREVIRLELTLQTAKRLQTNNEKIICMLHYPPTNTRRQPNEMTALIEKYGVSSVVFGHLHGKKVRADLTYTYNNITYHLTSCDLLQNTLVEIEIKD
ncbi:MAG: metallophosphoesterase [Clostridia bacterium]|nr:metallophosphoesterase [Clostridia bacterium]